jgi:DNA recombination protein RmuC
MILERILETNGLVRGREYDVQHPIKNEDGDQQYLDVIVHLPDNRKLIIDSKVTLVAYDRYCSSETDEDRARCLKDHIHALSTHIDQLSGKKYDQMDASPDFVMLFVPIEPAYMMAIQNDSDLWARAYAKRILLISPTNLMGAVKMVSDLWKRDQQGRNATEIANQGQKLYEKFIGFLSSMEDVGSHMTKSQDAFIKAMNQLKQGRGNLIRQAEKLKDLGVKTAKTVPTSMMNYEDEDGTVLDLSDNDS